MIETERLILKPLTEGELIRYFNSQIDFAIEFNLLPSKSEMDKETREAILNDLLPNIKDKNKNYLFWTMWIIIEKSSQAIIGGICFHGDPDENGEVEIGYGIDEECRNNGFMTETIAGIIAWLKKQNIKSVIAETNPDNISSIKVLEKNRFKIIKNDNDNLFMRLELISE